jgi:hypothetical protein
MKVKALQVNCMVCLLSFPNKPMSAAIVSLYERH